MLNIAISKQRIGPDIFIHCLRNSPCLCMDFAIFAETNCSRTFPKFEVDEGQCFVQPCPSEKFWVQDFKQPGQGWECLWTYYGHTLCPGLLTSQIRVVLFSRSRRFLYIEVEYIQLKIDQLHPELNICLFMFYYQICAGVLGRLIHVQLLSTFSWLFC